MAVPQYQKAVAKSRTAELLTSLKTLAQTSESTYLETGAYPTDFTVLPVSLPGRIRDYGDKKNYILTTPSGNEFWLETELNQISGVLYSVPTAVIQLNYFIQGNDKGKIRCRANPNNSFANELCKSLGGTYNGVVAGDNAYWLQ